MKTLLIIVLVILLLRLLVRILLPVILRSFAEKMTRNFFHMQDPQNPSRPEGDVEIRMDSAKPKVSSDDGVYVDFEEVK